MQLTNKITNLMHKRSFRSCSNGFWGHSVQWRSLVQRTRPRLFDSESNGHSKCTCDEISRSGECSSACALVLIIIETEIESTRHCAKDKTSAVGQKPCELFTHLFRGHFSKSPDTPRESTTQTTLRCHKEDRSHVKTDFRVNYKSSDLDQFPVKDIYNSIFAFLRIFSWRKWWLNFLLLDMKHRCKFPWLLAASVKPFQFKAESLEDLGN